MLGPTPIHANEKTARNVRRVFHGTFDAEFLYIRLPRGRNRRAENGDTETQFELFLLIETAIPRPVLVSLFHLPSLSSGLAGGPNIGIKTNPATASLFSSFLYH